MTSQMPSISLQQADLEAQEHQDQQDQLAQRKAEAYKQIQIQQIQQRAKDILSDAIDRDSNDTLIENLTNIYNTSTAAINKSNSDRKLLKIKLTDCELNLTESVQTLLRTRIRKAASTKQTCFKIKTKTNPRQS